MFIKDLQKCDEIIAGDNTTLRELINPLKENLKLGYSLAHARVKPDKITHAHRLRSSEVYYILQGRGEMYVDGDKAEVAAGQAIYIPPNSVQRIKNIGVTELIFLCIVDPAWKPEDEELLK